MFPWYLIFLKGSLVFPILLFSSISLHWSLRKAFLSLLAILWNSAFKWVHLSFSSLPLASLLFSAICKSSSDNHFAFVHFFFLGMVLITVPCHESLSIVLGTLSNNRMGKTRDLFKKIRGTKGTFHAKMGTIKDRNGMDLTEAENIKKRWQEYTKELYKKDLHDPDNHDGVKSWAGWSTNWNPDCQEKYQQPQICRWHHSYGRK